MRVKKNPPLPNPSRQGREAVQASLSSMGEDEGEGESEPPPLPLVREVVK